MSEYEITQITDLLNVPIASRPAMLADLATWMELHDHFRAHLGEYIADGSVSFPPVFRWNDDGIPGLRQVNITTVLKGEP